MTQWKSAGRERLSAADDKLNWSSCPSPKYPTCPLDTFAWPLNSSTNPADSDCVRSIRYFPHRRSVFSVSALPSIMWRSITHRCQSPSLITSAADNLFTYYDKMVICWWGDHDDIIYPDMTSRWFAWIWSLKEGIIGRQLNSTRIGKSGDLLSFYLNKPPKRKFYCYYCCSCW